MKKLLILGQLFLLFLACASNQETYLEIKKEHEEKFIRNDNVNREVGTTSKIVAYSEPPIPIKKIPPKYPKFAKNSGIEGSVLLEVEIFEDGSVGAVEVIKSLMGGENGLDQAAINAVKQWKFKPAKYKGKPVATWTTFEVNFNLQ